MINNSDIKSRLSKFKDGDEYDDSFQQSMNSGEFMAYRRH